MSQTEHRRRCMAFNGLCMAGVVQASDEAGGFGIGNCSARGCQSLHLLS